MKTLLMAAWVTLLFITSATAAPVAKYNHADAARLSQLASLWQQHLEPAAGGSAVSEAWISVAAHWQELREAAPAQQQEAARRLQLALRALEQAWQQQQPAADEEKPFFYAVDTATRMSA